MYLPPDANCLLSVADHCLRSRDYVNVIVAGKQPSLNYLTMEEAIAHCTRGIGIWDCFSSDGEEEPDVVLACAGDVPTLETRRRGRDPARAAARAEGPVVNVVDLMRLEPDSEHPHGLSERGVRRAVHDRPAGDLRLPRLPVSDSPPHLPPHQPRQHPRARLQGGGHDDDPVRHGDAQRPRPLPSRDGRHRPRPRAWPSAPPMCARRWPTSGCATAPTPASTARTRPMSATGAGRRATTAPANQLARIGAILRVLVVNAGSSSLKLTLLDER